MTVTLLQPYDGYARGASVDLDNATEAALVAQQRAVYTQNPGASFFPLTATEQQNLRDSGVAGATSFPVALTPKVIQGSATQAVAAINSLAINAALLGGNKSVALPPGLGEVYINQTLVIYSNTNFQIGPGTMLKLLVGAANGVNLLQNYALTQSASASSITWVWSSGLSATITWANHGRSVNDFVWTQGNATIQFNGCFRITSITDANNFVVELWRLPSGAPSGASTGLLMDQNITVNGGDWDYDYANNSSLSPLNGQAIRLGMVRNLELSNLSFGNSQSYNLFIGGVVDCVVDGVVHRGTNSDGIKVIGPAKNVTVRGAVGRVGDDGVSAQPKIQVGYIGYRFSYGDMIGIAFEDLDIEITRTGPSIVVAYPSVAEWLDVAVRRIKGRCNGNGVSVFGDDGLANVAQNIDIDGVDVCAINAVKLLGTGTICQKLTAKNLVFLPNANTGTSVFTADAGTILRAGYFHFHADAPSWGASDYAFNLLGTTEYVEMSGYLNPGSTGRLCQLGSGSTNGTVRAVGVLQKAGDNCITVPASATGKVVFDGCEISSTAVFVSTGGATNEVEFNNSRFLTATNGVIRTTNNPTITVKGYGSTLVAGSWIVPVGGAPTWRFYSWDIPVDVGATGFVKTISGQFAFNTSAGGARGTLVANRLVTCNGTNWIQVDTPANIF